MIAGSDGSGLVYRIPPYGKAFVLYSAPKKEITAPALDAAGNIYAAGVGEKHPATAPLHHHAGAEFNSRPRRPTVIRNCHHQRDSGHARNLEQFPGAAVGATGLRNLPHRSRWLPRAALELA